MFARLFVSAVISGLLIATASGAEYGRAVVNGKEVILFDDGTWKAITQKSGSDCTNIKSKIIRVSVCLRETEWRAAEDSEPNELEFESKGEDEIYAKLIAEKTYIPFEAMKKIILQIARGASNLEGIAVLRDVKKEFYGQEWGILEFKASPEGIKMFFSVIYGSEKERGSARFMVYGAADDANAIRALSERVTIKFD